MIITIYCILIISIISLLKNILLKVDINNENDLPKFLVTTFVYQKILRSIQFISIFLLVALFSPFKKFFFISPNRFIFYHIILLLSLFIRDVYVKKGKTLKIHTNIILSLLFLDTLKLN